ncbi:hypothetical protein ACVXHY_22225 [Enterobacter roggenkampii]
MHSAREGFALRLAASPLCPPLFAGLSCRHGDALYQSDTLQPDRISQLIAQLAGMRRFNCTARTVANLMSGDVTA